MRIPLIAANWKMNKTIFEASEFLSGLKEHNFPTDREVVICGPYTTLGVLQQALSDSEINCGAQNMHWEDSGAYTGEISTSMLKDYGCEYVIIGHSERRQYYNETDEAVNKKVQAALQVNFTPIVCVGETLELRQAHQTAEHIKQQIKKAFIGIDSNDYKKLVVAYEPIWAIGTGETATPEQAQEVHAMIRGIMGTDTRIIYGGSVNSKNVSELMAQADIDGALVGGASLEVEEFSAIVNYL